jgi:hypothetical protein
MIQSTVISISIIEFLRTQLLETEGTSNGTVYSLVSKI